VDKTSLLGGLFRWASAHRWVRSQPWRVADDTLWFGELIGAEHLDANERLITLATNG